MYLAMERLDVNDEKCNMRLLPDLCVNPRHAMHGDAITPRTSIMNHCRHPEHTDVTTKVFTWTMTTMADWKTSTITASRSVSTLFFGMEGRRGVGGRL
jgi:hypothetical protein